MICAVWNKFISDNVSGVESSARMMMIFGFTALVLQQLESSLLCRTR